MKTQFYMIYCKGERPVYPAKKCNHFIWAGYETDFPEQVTCGLCGNTIKRKEREQ